MEEQRAKIYEQEGNISEYDLKEIFTTQYNDLFCKLLKKTHEEFISLLKQQVILHLRIIDKQCDSSLLINLYKKYEHISKDDKIRIKKIYDKIKKYKENNLLYLDTLDIYVHCYKCKEAIHKCGNKLVNFENLFFCLKCQKVYNQNYIKLFCYNCNKTYITTKRSLEEKKYDYFYSISYAKYHCFTENEEKIKCLNCGDDLYYNINNVNLNLKNSQELRGMRDIFCIKCKLIFDTKEIFFTCRICGENFKAEPQIFKNFPSIKKYLLLLVHTFRKNVYALPDIITNKKCSCDLNGVQYFLHKDNGRLFEGNKNGKSVIICDHCYGVFKNENFNWNCPFCGGNFKAIKKNNNMKFDKNRRKINLSMKRNILHISCEIKKISDNKKKNFHRNIKNHSFYNSSGFSNEKNCNISSNYESSMQLTRELALSTKEKGNKNTLDYSNEKKTNEYIYKLGKSSVIKGNKTFYLKSNNKNGESNNQRNSVKNKNLGQVKLFTNNNKKNNEDLNSSISNKLYYNIGNKRAASHLNKNYNINNEINNLNGIFEKNSNKKNKAISSYKKQIIVSPESFCNIKEPLKEESFEFSTSVRKKSNKFDKRLEKILPKNIFLENKNNNSNINISINNNVIQLSCLSNTKKDNIIPKKRNISPDINIMNNNFAKKIIITENNSNNFIINSSKGIEIFKKEKIDKKDIKKKIKNALKNNKSKLNKENFQENKNYKNENIKNNKKPNIIKKQNTNINEDKNKEKNFNTIIINSDKRLFNREKIQIKKNSDKKELINNNNNKDKDKKIEKKRIKSEKKSDKIQKMNLIIEDDEIQTKNKIKKNQIKIKKINENKLNKSNNIKIPNASKNPNVFIITNLSENKNEENRKNNSMINNNLNIFTKDNNNFVYIIPNSTKNKKISNEKKNFENMENIKPNNFIYTSKINELNLNSISPIRNNFYNEYEQIKIENIHIKNNSNFHANKTDKINNIIDNKNKKEEIQINNYKNKDLKNIKNNSKNKNKNDNNNNKNNLSRKKNNENVIKNNNCNINKNNNNINSIDKNNIIILKNNYNTNNDKEINDNIINKNNINKNENDKNNLNDNTNDNFLKLKIYFSSLESKKSKHLNRNYSFDIRASKNHFSILTQSDNLNIKTFDSDYYTIIRQIGTGSYGKIYLVEDPKTKQQFALKKIIIGDAQELKENQNEYNLTWKLTKLNPDLKIVKKYGIEIKKLDKYNLVIYVLMEAANCDWEQELMNRQKDNAFYSEIELIEILKSLVNTLAELQKRGISHRDVKPQNILCFGKDGYKLSDFGEAKAKRKNYIVNNMDFEDNTRKQTVRGTELYMSPILFKALQMKGINGAQYNAYKSDVFSLGMCFLLASSLNYQSLFDVREIYDMEIVKKIVQKYLDKRYSQNYINLILNMLQINEKLRPDFIELNSMII